MKRSLIWIAMWAGACNAAPSAEQRAATPGAPTSSAISNPATPASPSSPAPAVAPTPAANGRPAAAVTPASPTIPAGAKFTIFCDAYTGPDHVAQANAMKALLLKNSRVRDWYVVHSDAQSTLYEGYYKEFDAALPGLDAASKADAQRARRDKALVEAIPNPRAPEQKLFPRALFQPLDASDPDAPPEWNLVNAPGYWSVQVAAFTGFDRKAKTVEAVRQARAMTPPVEAYYYHGGPNDSVSIVCVGKWPIEAIKKQGQSVAKTSGGSNQTIVVDATGEDMTPAQLAQMTGGKQDVQVYQTRVEILDPTLKQALADYPEHAVDGMTEMVQSQDANGKIEMVPRGAMIVPIPHGPPALAGRPPRAGQAADDDEPTLLNPGRTTDLGARLKGLGR